MQLSKTDTDALKGVALLLLLAHHLFAYPAGEYDELIEGHQFLKCFGVLAKICVAIFVLLSGYGLTVQAMAKGVKPIPFYKRRLSKIYTNYWLIWLMFVPLGVFVFGRGLVDVFGSDNTVLKSITDFFGLSCFFGYWGYNPTWWYISCIIVLYLFFPLFYFLLRRQPIVLIAVCIALSVVRNSTFRLPEIYFLPFLVGMLLAYYKPKYLSPKSMKGRFLTLSIFFVIFCGLSTIKIVTQTVELDFILASLVVLIYINAPIARWMKKGLGFLGHHSMNIFLTHTFIYAIFFSALIYSHPNPFLIYIKLLVASILLSMLIDAIKYHTPLKMLFGQASTPISQNA